VLLIDHTGLYDDTRARGHGSVRAAMDTEIKVSYDQDARVATATVDRDKNAEAGKAWSYRLSTEGLSTVRLVSGQAVVDHSAPVPVPITGSDQPSPFATGGEWWAPDAEPLPQTVIEALPLGEHCASADCPGDGHKPATVNMAYDVYRVLRAKAGAMGLTRTEIKAAMDEAGRWNKTAGYAAINALDAHGVISTGSSGQRFTVA
jgi:hypothetical protein